jgi:hypothetical protein
MRIEHRITRLEKTVPVAVLSNEEYEFLAELIRFGGVKSVNDPEHEQVARIRLYSKMGTYNDLAIVTEDKADTSTI